MPRMKCPRCATIVDVAAGASPVCPACGFGSTAAPAAAPAPVAPTATPGFSSPPPAQWAAGSAKPPRPGWVTFVGVYWFIGAAISLLVGLVAVVAGGAIAAAFEDGYGEFGDLIAGLIIVVGVVLIVFGLLGVLLGVNIMKGRNWARITTLVLSIMGIVFGGLSLVMGDFTSVVGLALNVLVVVALFRPESKAYFGAGPPVAPAR